MEESLNTNTLTNLMRSHDGRSSLVRESQQDSDIPEDEEPPLDRTDNPANTFSCDRCPKRYAYLAHLKSHQKFCKTPLEVVESKTQMCHLCPAKFKTTAAFRYHMLKHNGETPYGCRSEGCTKGFHSPKARLAHEKSCGKEQPKDGTEPVVCDICGVVLKSVNALIQHNTHHREPRHECHICNEKFVWKIKLGSHYRKKHKVEPPWKQEVGEEGDSDDEKECGDCGRVFDNATNLRMHKRFCKSAAVLNCEQCGSVFTDKARFGYHMNQHNGLRPFQCQIEGCTKAFFSPDTRKKHHRVCGKSAKPIECSICWAKLKTADSLRVHMETHSTGPRPTCHICGQEFTMKGNLREHLKRHEKGTFKGTRVKTSLKCKSRYQNGRESSEEVEPRRGTRKRKATAVSPPEKQSKSVFEMDEIKQEIVYEEIVAMEPQPPETDQSFNPVQSRKKILGARVKPRGKHTCTECGTSFAKAGSLKNHAKVHSKRDYECTICSKKLLNQASLDAHMRTHEVEKPDSLEIHSCDDCSKSFISLRALREHRLYCEQTGASMAASGSYCHLCPAAFQEADQLRIHLGEHDANGELEDITLKCRREGCEERFSNCGDLWEHEADCEEVGHFLCDICEEAITEFDGLQKHEENHLGRAADCGICGETFYSESDSEHHWRTHFGQALLDAELTKYANWSLMESMPKSTFCELCSKGFVTELVLQLHLLFCEQR